MQRIGTPTIGRPTAGGYCKIRFEVDTSLTAGWQAALEVALDCRVDGVLINRGGGSCWTIERDRQLMVLAGHRPAVIAYRLRTVDTILTHATRLYDQHGRPLDERHARLNAYRNQLAEREAAEARERERIAQQFTC